MLKIYNTISRKKEEFVPINDGQVSIYVCGVTVYDYCHIGHARTYLFFDTVTRYFHFLGHKVTLVRNITDIDDKILNKSKQSHQSFEYITKTFIQAMHEDFAALGLLKPQFEPKATEFITEMLHLINILLSNNYAYIGNNGDVFYNVSTFKNYGLLSKHNFNNMQHTDRLEQEVQNSKHHSQDFVLWKLVNHSEPGWQSPWGYGRPGWHTECTAMSLKLFDKTFDIHGGGFDLMFPHHENEIAQAEAVTGNTFVNYWMHVGFLQINQEKMSKSKGNFTLIRDLLKEVHPEIVRYFMLSSHYRTQIEFSYDKLHVAKNSLERLYMSLRNLSNSDPDDINYSDPIYVQYEKKFKDAMNDDFNTPFALTVLFELSKEINIIKEKSIIQANSLAITLKKLANSLGLLLIDGETFLHTQTHNNINISEQEIENLIAERNKLRTAKNWQAADLIRNQLAEQGIFLEDNGADTIWRR